MSYELMLVANSERADQLLSRVEKVIKELNAQSVKVERLGKKQLGYSIKKQSDGTYFVLNFEMEADGVKPLGDKLRLEEEDLLRHLLIRVEKKLKKGKGKKAVESKVEEDEKEARKPKVTVVTKAAVSAKVEKKKAGKGTKVAKVSKVSKAKKGKK